MRLALLGLLAVCAVVFATTRGERSDAERPAGAGAPRSGPRAPAAVRPRKPAGYRVPRNAVRVDTAAELRAALRRPERTAIVLAPGTYSGTEPFLNPHGHRLYAAEARPRRAHGRAEPRGQRGPRRGHSFAAS